VLEFFDQERNNRRADLMQSLAGPSANLWMIVPRGLDESGNDSQAQRGQGVDGLLPLAVCGFGGFQHFESMTC